MCSKLCAFFARIMARLRGSQKGGFQKSSFGGCSLDTQNRDEGTKTERRHKKPERGCKKAERRYKNRNQGTFDAFFGLPDVAESKTTESPETLYFWGGGGVRVAILFGPKSEKKKVSKRVPRAWGPKRSETSRKRSSNLKKTLSNSYLRCPKGLNPFWRRHFLDFGQKNQNDPCKWSTISCGSWFAPQFCRETIVTSTLINYHFGTDSAQGGNGQRNFQTKHFRDHRRYF